jgi:predicted nucleic acid-binding protein
MMKKVYIETTIPSFYHNLRPEPEMVTVMNWTRQWWDQHRAAYEVVSSPAVIDELREGEHRQKREKIALLANVPMLEVTAEVLEIVEVYIAHKLMPQDRSGDALHLALASHYGCDILLTWNCVHLANANEFPHIQRVNALLGLPVPVLATPLQLME